MKQEAQIRVGHGSLWGLMSKNTKGLLKNPHKNLVLEYGESLIMHTNIYKSNSVQQ